MHKVQHAEKASGKTSSPSVFTPFVEKAPDTADLGLKPEPQDKVDRLMQKLSIYLQYVRASGKRNSKYVIGRQCPGLVTDYASPAKKGMTDREKFLLILPKYNELMGTNYLA